MWNHKRRHWKEPHFKIRNRYGKFRENQTRSKPVLRLNYSQNSPNGTLETKDDTTAHMWRRWEFSPLTIRSSLFRKIWKETRDERLLFATVLSPSSSKLYVPLDFEDSLLRQSIWLVVYQTQHQNFAQKVFMKRRDRWRNGYGS